MCDLCDIFFWFPGGTYLNKTRQDIFRSNIQHIRWETSSTFIHWKKKNHKKIHKSMQKELLMSNNLFYSSQKWELAASQIFLWIVIQYFINQKVKATCLEMQTSGKFRLKSGHWWLLNSTSFHWSNSWYIIVSIASFAHKFIF